MKKHCLITIVLVFHSIFLNAQIIGDPGVEGDVTYCPAITEPVTQALINKGIVSNNCPMVGCPYIENTCIAGIQRQIARMVAAEHLVEWNIPTTCWGYMGCNTLPDTLQFPCPNTACLNNSYPYDSCSTHYCPDDYADIIGSFVSIGATLIARAVNIHGDYHKMEEGSTFYDGVKQLVIDINAAYDCAGLRRPVIQGTIMENLSTALDDKEIVIPPFVLEEFKDEIISSGEEGYYYDSNGASLNRHFKFDRITFDANLPNNCFSQGPPSSNTPDITKIETKLWFFHVAKLFIDAGYTSIHISQMVLWGFNDACSGYSDTRMVLQRIRDYASRLETFVLLTQESYKALKHHTVNPDQTINFDPSHKFMFDFDIRALRPREVSTPQVCGEFDCNNPINDYLDGTVCDFNVTRTPPNSQCPDEYTNVNGHFPAVIDECVIKSSGKHYVNYYIPNTFGYSPIHNCYLPYQPFATYFDFAAGGDDSAPVLPTSGCNEVCSNLTGGQTWGFDDPSWFDRMLSPDCRIFWMEDAICRMRNFYNGFGFMIAPGLLLSPTPMGQLNRRFLLRDEPLLVAAIAEKWDVNLDGFNNLNVSFNCVGDDCSNFPIGSERVYRLNVNDYDCSTVYTWHIKQPDNSWVPFTYGKGREFPPTQDGVHTIYIREDNAGAWHNEDPMVPGGPSNHARIKAYEVFMTTSCCLPPGSGKVAIESNNTDEVIFERKLDLTEFNDYIANNKHFQETNESNEELVEATNEEILLFPNPVENTLFVSYSNEVDKIEVYNLQGKIVYQSKGDISNFRKTKIDVSNFNSGYYLLVGKSNGKLLYKKKFLISK